MPKGVEHIRQFSHGDQFISAQIPLMPKGVEHSETFPQDLTAASANSSDAERR